MFTLYRLASNRGSLLPQYLASYPERENCFAYLANLFGTDCREELSTFVIVGSDGRVEPIHSL